MKLILSIIIAFLYCFICSCASREAMIKKYCKQDTLNITVTVHDTIITPVNKIDTFFSNTLDTFYFEKENIKNGKKVGKLKLSYSNNNGNINLKADCETDTFYYEKKIFIPVAISCPKLVWYKHYAAEYWWLWPLFISMYFGIAYFHKSLNKL